MPHHGTARRSRARGAGPSDQRTREGPASRPVLDSCSDSLCFCLFAVPRLQPAAQWVRGPPCRPAGTRTGASAASVIRRTSHQADCSRAPPKPTSVTQTQPGGSTSSVERVDGIGSSFPLGATAGAPVATRSHPVSHLDPRRVNPTRTGHSRRPRWGATPSRELHPSRDLIGVPTRRRSAPRRGHLRSGSWHSRPPRRTRPRS